MEEQFITYTVKGRVSKLLWEFKYHLNGDFFSFTIHEGQLNGKQMEWLFSGKNFPTTDNLMNIMWIKNKDVTKVLEITKADLDLTFDAFWNAYGHKIGKKKMAENTWNKLSRAVKMRAVMAIKDYNGYLSRNPGIQKAHATTYLNQEYYDNEWKSTV